MNAVEYIRSLEAVGFTRVQAEAQAQGLTGVMETKFATKQDLLDFTNRFTLELNQVRQPDGGRHYLSKLF